MTIAGRHARANLSLGALPDQHRPGGAVAAPNRWPLPIDPAHCDTPTFQTAGLSSCAPPTTKFINPLTSPCRDPALDHGKRLIKSSPTSALVYCRLDDDRLSSARRSG